MKIYYDWTFAAMSFIPSVWRVGSSLANSVVQFAERYTMGRKKERRRRMRKEDVQVVLMERVRAGVIEGVKMYETGRNGSFETLLLWRLGWMRYETWYHSILHSQQRSWRPIISTPIWYEWYGKPLPSYCLCPYVDGSRLDQEYTSHMISYRSNL